MAKRKTKSEDEVFQSALRMIAPGTDIREAISAILQSHMGGLICIGNPPGSPACRRGG